MKSLEQLDRWIASKLRDWTTHVAGRPESTHLLEVRREILEDIRDQVEPAGDGKSVFPYQAVSIDIAVEDEQQHAAVESAFVTGDALAGDIRDMLAEMSCPAAAIQITVSMVNDAVLAVSDRPFRIRYLRSRADSPAAAVRTRPRARLEVLRGQADAAEFVIASDRVNLGRLKEVVGDRDGLRRRNDIAFAETETTVSREHAYIRYHGAEGRFRLYDCHSQRGTRVFREGRRLDVPRGGGRGLQLQSGDEIHLGEARVLFTIES